MTNANYYKKLILLLNSKGYSDYTGVTTVQDIIKITFCHKDNSSHKVTFMHYTSLNKDKYGVLLFNNKDTFEIPPNKDFGYIIKELNSLLTKK